MANIILTELQAKVVKTDLEDWYTVWEQFHLYLAGIKDVDEKVCDTLLSSFRHACGVVHEKWCRTITEHPDGDEREKDCPMYSLCGASGEMKGHKLYCELAGAARDKDIETVKTLLKELTDDSLIELKKIRDNW